jgi:hypothetical protein
MADGGSALLARLQQLPHPVSPADAQGVEQVTDDLHEVLYPLLTSLAGWKMLQSALQAPRSLLA